MKQHILLTFHDLVQDICEKHQIDLFSELTKIHAVLDCDIAEIRKLYGSLRTDTKLEYYQELKKATE